VVLRNVSEEYLQRISQYIDRKDDEFTQNSQREFLQDMFEEDDLSE